MYSFFFIDYFHRLFFHIIKYNNALYYFFTEAASLLNNSLLNNTIKVLTRSFFLILIGTGLFCVYYFNLHRYFTFQALNAHHQVLQDWTSKHYVLTVFIYLFLYILSVALSVPGAAYLTIAGGFLFGPLATLYVVFGATVGATLLFLAVRTALGEWFLKKVSGYLVKMEKGFQENAFNYLLTLRLIPVFQFWVINIVAALLAIRLRTFVLATFIGIIPGSFIYVMVGNSLQVFLKTNQPPNLNIIFTPTILLPLLGLAFFSLLPVIYKRWKRVKK